MSKQEVKVKIKFDKPITATMTLIVDRVIDHGKTMEYAGLIKETNERFVLYTKEKLTDLKSD